MHLRCDGIFNDSHYTVTAESEGERVLKTGEHLAKWRARVECPVSFDLCGVCRVCAHARVRTDHGKVWSHGI